MEEVESQAKNTRENNSESWVVQVNSMTSIVRQSLFTRSLTKPGIYHKDKKYP